MADEQQIPDFPLPKFLELTPERLAQNEENQRAWRETAGSLSRNPILEQKTRAVLIEKDARASIETILNEPDGDDPGQPERQQNALRHQKARLSEALAIQGRYDEAAGHEPNPRKAKEWQDIWEAVWRDDKEDCPCPAYRIEGTQKLLNHTQAAKIYSLKHGRDMALLKCHACGFMNVKTLTPELIEQRKTQKWRHFSN